MSYFTNYRRRRAGAKFLSTSKGFTLIELLVVIAVIGVLASIAIPQFCSYRARGVDTQMKSDIKNAVIAMESYYATLFTYPSTVAQISNYGYHQTDGVNLIINITSLTQFTVTASKPGGTQASFTYNSVTGQTN
jgi:prepilin-type N-terminal cleavage/methylation domain-containing protein